MRDSSDRTSREFYREVKDECLFAVLVSVGDRDAARGPDRAVAYAGTAHRGSEATGRSRTAVGLAGPRDTSPVRPWRAAGYGTAGGPPAGTTSTR